MNTLTPKIINKEINAFKDFMRANTAKTTVSRFLTSRGCFVYNNEVYADLKREVADFLEVHSNDIIIVGSAKLGFSITETKRTDPKTGEKCKMPRYQHFSTEDSDIDVAVSNTQIFDKCWSLALNTDWQQKREFGKYLFKGWIRPDKLPDVDFKIRWFDFFNTLRTKEEYGKIKITCGLYKNWQFLEKYQIGSVEACMQADEVERLVG